MINRRVLKIAGGVLAVIVLGMALAGFKTAADLNAYKRQVAVTVITDVDLAVLPDGLYRGDYDVKWVAAEVEVSLKDHRISTIELLSHKNGKGKPAEAILDKVLGEQSLKVDVVSGATSSSKAILKAIENALEQGPVLD